MLPSVVFDSSLNFTLDTSSARVVCPAECLPFANSEYAKLKGKQSQWLDHMGLKERKTEKLHAMHVKE